MLPRSPAPLHGAVDRPSAAAGSGARREPPSAATPGPARQAAPTTPVAGLRDRLDDLRTRIRVGLDALGRRAAVRLDDLADRITARIERERPRRAGISPPPIVVGLAAAVVIVVIAGAVVLIGQRSTDTSKSSTEPAIAEPVPVGPPATRESAAPIGDASAFPGSTETQIARQRLSTFIITSDHDPDPRTAVFVDRLRLAPPYGAVDSAVFDTTRQRFRLYGIWPVARDEVCLGDDGRRLACGLMARAALQNHMAGKEVVCDPMFGVLEPPPELIEVRCRLAGDDLALRMIRAGWAFPSRQAGRLEAEALAEAIEARRGYWNGPQTAPVVDHAIADAEATPFGSLTQPAFGGPADPAARSRAGEPAAP